ncbi:tRNA 2-selenouridine synthase [mine drainage metagenome]|uniref:tRNA 2-selenouridine synthase n=1 Tax=mine drainage metagenome TaxID=410659 RepID=A0A1J5RTX5_9ZZZZ
MRIQGAATVAQLGEFDELIDARSPAEYADDHIPGAISCPVLDDEQRARVGTLYQGSPFEARKIGAIWVARNVADHIERLFLAKPRDWRPLVYCWRGGQRSGAFSHILRQIGWDAQRLEGGYKSWRRHVIDALALLPQRFSYRVVGGATGSGKSRLLEALSAAGAQVLHLEQLASHKGSVLGPLPQTQQPSQRSFESRIHAQLCRFDPERPVYVEAESRRIGSVQLPDALLEAIRAAPGLRIEATLAARVAFLLQDYDYFLADPVWLIERLEQLTGVQSRETVARWVALARGGAFPTLVEQLLEQHYDPLYLRSQAKNFAGFSDAATIECDDLSPDGMARLAREILARA